MKHLKHLLKFLSLGDDQGNLSLTNLAMLIIVVKIALVPQASLIDLGTLLLAAANYAHKRYVNSKTQEPAPPVNLDPLHSRLSQAELQATTAMAVVENLTKDVNSIKTAITFKNLK